MERAGYFNRLPRGLSNVLSSTPRTPEPSASHGEPEVPSPPRQPKLRVKRRVASNLSAPTQQFLASVAAVEAFNADIPIPSVEEPYSAEHIPDLLLTAPQMVANSSVIDSSCLAPPIVGRRFPVPQTPVPEESPVVQPRRFPDWSAVSPSSRGSSPDGGSSRPSTARSTFTNGSHLSRESCLSDDRPSPGPGSDDKKLLNPKPIMERKDTVESSTRRLRKKTPWTKAMNKHLWNVYVQYMQDPTLTPVRMGKSCIPPEGLCSRVAREAKRTWRGSRPSLRRETSVTVIQRSESESRSTTPTPESPATFMQWPHSTASTRAQLRELCKQQATTNGVRNCHFMSQSPTPLQQTPRREPHGASCLNCSDLNKMLVLSTSDSMQPNGPLARLALEDASSVSPPLPSPATISDRQHSDRNSSSWAPLSGDAPRLASPFVARSYGPSSSGALVADLPAARATAGRHTVSGRRNTLQSPVRLTHSRNPTYHRRRPKQLSLDARRRPGLQADIFLEPFPGTQLAAAPPAESTTASTSTVALEDPFNTSTSATSATSIPPIPTATTGSGAAATGSVSSLRPSHPLHTRQPSLPIPVATQGHAATAPRPRGRSLWIPASASPAGFSLTAPVRYPPPLLPLDVVQTTSSSSSSSPPPRLGSPFMAAPTLSQQPRSVPNRYSLPQHDHPPHRALPQQEHPRDGAAESSQLPPRPPPTPRRCCTAYPGAAIAASNAQSRHTHSQSHSFSSFPPLLPSSQCQTQQQQQSQTPRTPLAYRLAYIDQRLRELNQKGIAKAKAASIADNQRAHDEEYDERNVDEQDNQHPYVNASEAIHHKAQQ